MPAHLEHLHELLELGHEVAPGLLQLAQPQLQLQLPRPQRLQLRGRARAGVGRRAVQLLEQTIDVKCFPLQQTYCRGGRERQFWINKMRIPHPIQFP